MSRSTLNREDPASPPRVRWPETWKAILGPAIAAGILALTVLLSIHPVATTDFFWQLASGDWILREHSVPRTDPFSYTAEGNAWIDLHWGFQIVLSLLYRIIGLDGLTLFRAFLATATVALLLFGFTPRKLPLAGLGAVFLAVLASHERFLLRPELLSFLFLVLTLLLLERFLRIGSGRGVYLLIPLLVLWVNVHSLFILGLLVVGICLSGELLDRGRSRWAALKPEGGGSGRREVVITLAAVLGLGMLATWINPFGFRAWSLPLLQFTGRISPGTLYSSSIAEFQQPFDAGTGTLAIVAWWVLAAVTALVVMSRGHRLPTRHLLLFASFFWLAFRARRNLPLFSIVAIPILIEPFRRSGTLFPPARWRRMAGMGGRLLLFPLILLLMMAICGNHFYLWERMDRRFGSGVLEGIAPVGAADFLIERSLSGRVFHALDDGGYLIWRAYPERRVFIDGRLEVYDEGTYRSYLRALEEPQWFEELAAQHGIRNVLWNHAQASIAHSLLNHLAHSDAWNPVYIDSASILFRKALPEHLSAGEPAKLDLDSLPAVAILEAGRSPETVLDRFLKNLVPWRVEAPTTALRLGIQFALLGQPRQAEAFLMNAAVAPSVPPEVPFDLGLVYESIGFPEKAVLKYEEARLLGGWGRDPLGRLFRRKFRSDVLFRLGDAYIRSGMEDRGVAVLAKAGRKGQARLFALEGFHLQSDGKILAAIGKYQAALDLEPNGVDVLQNLGIALIADAVSNLDSSRSSGEKLEEAGACFEKTVALRPGFAPAHLNLGLIRVQQGRLAEARASFEEAARYEPENPVPIYQLGRVRAMMKQFDGAAEAFTEAVRLGPDFPEAHFHLGRIWEGKGEDTRAMTSYQRSMDLGLRDPFLLLQMAGIHARRGEDRKAIDLLRQLPLSDRTWNKRIDRKPELKPLMKQLSSAPSAPPS